MKESFIPGFVKEKRKISIDRLFLSLKDPLYRNSLFLLLGRLLNVGMGFLFWLIAARLYPTGEVGIATALITSLGLIVFISSLGFNFSLIRYININVKENVLSTSIIITTVAAAIVAIAYLVIVNNVLHSISILQKTGYALFFFITVVVNSVFFMSGEAFKALRDTRDFFLQNLALAIRVPLLLPFVFMGNFGIFGAIGVTYMISTVFSLHLLLKRANIIPKIDKEYLKESFTFSSGNYVSNLLYESPALMMPTIILSLLGEEEAALYYIAYSVSNLIWIAPMAISTSLFVEGSYGEGIKRNLIRSGVVVFILLIPSILIVYIFGSTILQIFGEDYVEALSLLHILVLSSFFVVLHNFFVPVLNIQMKVKELMKVNFIRFSLLLGLSYVLLGEYGVVGFGYAWMLSYMVLTLVMLRISWREGWICIGKNK
ncbi:oligosaccharide flippase family protein [Methanolobus zinderi]|jgi:O-antigen/teichoic acid export membrane protein|uniref:Oligosaccharide flippase family protein n=1 Tax=Methanolobus zinderi TaxID=536044 RepID=A0A7D5E7X3_9EURY|nr:MAG: membrane protein [Methanolobus sp. T82-4]QLC49958.1 oligosaccharide flippase family protein [Methanolobus zinderi]